MKILLPIVFALLPALSSAHGPITLKQVQVTNGSQVDLLFDGRVGKGQIRTEFFNDIIQVSLTDAAVYPAKISSVTGGKLLKVFAYQYAPKLVRCRLTVSGKAESFKDRVRVEPSGRMITIKLSDESAGTDKVAFSASAPAHVAPGGAGDGSPAAKAAGPAQAAKVELVAPPVTDADERALLERVLAKEPAPAQTAAPAPKAEPAKSESAKAEGDAALPSSEDKPLDAAPAAKPRLTSGKSLPSPLAAFGKLAAVLGLFGVLALLARKAFGKMRGRETGILGAIGRFANKSLGGQGKLIDIVSSHHLGPKKSIVVARIAGRTLVLGVTNESINLITQLEGDELLEQEKVATASATPKFDFNFDDEPAMWNGRRARSPATGAGATSAGPAVFSDLLTTEAAKPAAPSVAPPAQPQRQALAPLAHQAYGAAAAAPAAQPASASASSPARDRIRSRLEGLKQW